MRAHGLGVARDGEFDLATIGGLAAAAAFVRGAADRLELAQAGLDEARERHRVVQCDAGSLRTHAVALPREPLVAESCQRLVERIARHGLTGSPRDLT